MVPPYDRIKPVSNIINGLQISIIKKEIAIALIVSGLLCISFAIIISAPIMHALATDAENPVMQISSIIAKSDIKYFLFLPHLFNSLCTHRIINPTCAPRHT